MLHHTTSRQRVIILKLLAIEDKAHVGKWDLCVLGDLLIDILNVVVLRDPESELRAVEALDEDLDVGAPSLEVVVVLVVFVVEVVVDIKVDAAMIVTISGGCGDVCVVVDVGWGGK